MRFELLPVVDLMIELYQKPRDIQRFNEYLRLLQSNSKGDLIFPIGGFNPMAKEYVLLKLEELKTLKAEGLIKEALQVVNIAAYGKQDSRTFKVALNLSDDLGGGWTNRYTSDYDSKYKLNPLVNRNFITPVFWTGESFSEEIIRTRTLEYCYRTLTWLVLGKPATLEDHMKLETEVYRRMELEVSSDIDITLMEGMYNKYKGSSEYVPIFNFLYGDNASIAMGYNPSGIAANFAGFKYANYLSKK